MVMEKLLLVLLLPGVFLRPPNLRYKEKDATDDRLPNWYDHRSLLGKRGMDSSGRTETPINFQQRDGNIYSLQDDNPLMRMLLRGKRSSAFGMDRGFPCTVQFRRFRRCTMNMILRDKNNDLHKILYGHA
eukprot:GFUD01014970.1.p1 GENE.GFUD01014970.1~~GFUD01014970.1.p1  ORF type:complete len:130 (-),score=18.83 GFUD01014970.1:16-405(-)